MLKGLKSILMLDEESQSQPEPVARIVSVSAPRTFQSPRTSGSLSGRTTPQANRFQRMEQEFVMPKRNAVSAPCSGQHTPLEPPEVDLSHLNSEERAQIAQVMAKATQMQNDETSRIR